MSDPFIGEIKMVAFPYAPVGWAFCNGQILPIAQNTALFSLLGMIYGGDGKTTFALPNLQGRAPLHPGTGLGLTKRTLGEMGGETGVTLNSTNLASHTHAAYAALGNDSTGPTNSSWGTLGVGRNPPASYQTGSPNVTMKPDLLGSAGSLSPTAHNNMQPYLAVNFIIATMGIYPARP